MSLILFEGAAGTGKTTRLLKAAREEIQATPLGEDQKVLGLTKYHGSRRRMEEALKGPEGVGRSVDCVTIDSFAWHLVRRWRSLAHELGLSARQGDFQAITSAAGQLLEHPAVGAWVARKYPLLVVDELQDCKGGAVTLLSGLGPHLRIICAADGFQDLSGDAENEAVSWAKSIGEIVPLDYNWRTRVDGLLAAADSIRKGKPLRSDRETGFEIVSAPRAAAGGGRVSWRFRLWSRSQETVVISPTAPGTSPFVTSLLNWVGEKKAKSKKTKATAGPYKLEWEASEEELGNRLLESLEVPEDPTSEIGSKELAEAARQANAHDVRDWVNKQRNVSGRNILMAGEVTEEIRRIVHRRRAFGTKRRRKRFALTIHQAKNREFESVIVLWPLRLRSHAEQQRRLLYNAITRAREQALVVVQDPKRNRLQEPLFSGS